MTHGEMRQSADNWRTLGWVWVIAAGILSAIVANSFAQQPFGMGTDGGVFIGMFLVMFVGSLVPILPYFGISRILGGLADVMAAQDRASRPIAASTGATRTQTPLPDLPRAARPARRPVGAMETVGVVVPRDSAGMVLVPAATAEEIEALVWAAATESTDPRAAPNQAWIAPPGEVVFDLSQVVGDPTHEEAAVAAVRHAVEAVRSGPATKVVLTRLDAGLVGYAQRLAAEAGLSWSRPEPDECAVW